ncbi:unnamed protein product [Sphenostylis stenocarpa]|uniref:Uncharacterized protein n=1 Tax=Sphenostylis stenocarpa TaxID=92480 RepID=A0AA86RXY8_9FABA|nr:unnamed protein product [Sphenostylis stenocarpa]
MRLANMFATIKASLEDAEEKQFSHTAVKDWLKNLYAAAHMVEDIIDDCAYEAFGLEYQGVKGDRSYKLTKTEMIAERRNEVIEERQTTIFSLKVHGREIDVDRILVCLLTDGRSRHYHSSEEYLKVVPIVGDDGIGKTTIAKLIFNHRMDWERFSWNWRRLKSVLDCGKKGASILVTTCLPEVAKIMGTLAPYKVSMLSFMDGWELFKSQAFRPNKVKQEELAVIGNEIVKKCGQIPLAIKVVGGLLRFKREKEEWLYVMNSNIWKLPQVKNCVTPALILSYLDLTIRLKQCFAYFSMFPKGETIGKQYLIELWMANGFISSSEKLDVEEVGDDVWNELYNRSFFEDIKTDEYGIITSFMMHDLVLEHAILVAKDIIFSPKDEFGLLLDSTEFQHVRTYLMPDGYSVHFPPGVFKLHYLRVLHLRVRGELSPSIGDLKHLRYLNLSKSDFKTLPDILCKLWNLQILKLDYCKHLQRLPNSLTDLKSLQKLSFKDCHKLSSLPPQMGKLTSLRSLTSYFVGNEREFFLADLGALKLREDLDIKNLEKVKSVNDVKEANMSGKRLSQLRLSWDRNEETKLGEDVEKVLEVLQPNTQQLVSLTVTGYPGALLPRWMFSPSLKKLQIERCRKLRSLPEALQGMNALQSLRLNDLPNLESLPDCFEHLFCLRQLAIGFCGKLRRLPITRRPNLRLEIYACPELEKLPQRWAVPGDSEIIVNGCLRREKLCALLTEDERSYERETLILRSGFRFTDDHDL